MQTDRLVGVIRGSPSAVAVNEQSQVVDGQLVSENTGLRLRPRIERYVTVPELLDAIVAGEVRGWSCQCK